MLGGELENLLGVKATLLGVCLGNFGFSVSGFLRSDSLGFAWGLPGV